MTLAAHAAAPLAVSDAAVLTKAVLRAADHLGVTARTLAAVIGVSEATLSRMKKSGFSLDPGSKPFELALMFVRAFRSLDALVGGDEAVARAWMKAENSALGGRPIELVQSLHGLIETVAYLDARRARV